MDLANSIPEKYVDIVMEEFAYDPIRLPSTEDPSQVLYNRRTLETISDTKHTAINPYTGLPFQILNAIPQTELKEQMCDYMLNHRSVTLSLRLEVIPDYTQILNETEMKNLLEELVLAGNQCLGLLKKTERRRGRRNRKPDDEELENWKTLWKKLNLVRLYCQYRTENREVFLSINGYEYLLQVTCEQLRLSCREYSGSSFDDAKEVCKEVARIVDVVGGLEEIDLQMQAPESSLLAFVCILFDLANSEYLKLQTMVLRIYRRICHDCEYNHEDCIDNMFKIALHVLAGRENHRDIVNEDLYNGMAIFRAAWINNIRVFNFQHSVEVLCMVVTVCISRLQELHDAQTIPESSSRTSGDRDDNGQVEKNIYLISMALHQGLFLIYSLLTLPPIEEDPNSYASRRETLQRMDIVKQIVRMVELILSGNKFFRSSHLRFGFEITVAFGLSGHRRNEQLQVFEKFLGSKFLDDYSEEVKLSLQYIVLAFPRDGLMQSWLSPFIELLLPCLGGSLEERWHSVFVGFGVGMYLLSACILIFTFIYNQFCD